MFEGNYALFIAGIIAWFAMLIGAIFNGALRENVLEPRLGSAALPLSGMTAAVIFTLITYIMLTWLDHMYATRELLMLGLFWLLLTVVFEFAFGRYVLRKNWGELWAAYDLRTGNLLSLVLLYIIFLPLLVSRWFDV